MMCKPQSEEHTWLDSTAVVTGQHGSNVSRQHRQHTLAEQRSPFFALALRKT